MEKELNRREILKRGLVELLFLGENLKSEEKKETKEKKPFYYKTLDEIIIVDFLDSYLKRVTPKSNTFQKLKKKHGKKGVLERYSSGHRLCLDLAFKYQDKPFDKIPEKEYVSLGQQLSKKQHETSKGLSRVNYLNKKVAKSFQEWSRIKTANFYRLLNAEKEVEVGVLKTKEQKQDYVKQLHQAAYTKKEYEKYVKEQNKANDATYKAMKGTLGLIEKMVGSKQITRIRDMTRIVYIEPLKRYFNEDEKKD